MALQFDKDGLVIVPLIEKKEFTKENLISWRDRYDKEEDLYSNREEETVGAKLRDKGFMTKDDLTRIMKWKFQGRLLGRQKRMLNLLESCNSSLIEKFSKEAFNSNDDELKIVMLSNIPAVKNSLSSVILTFYDSKNYGILDIHSWRELFGKEPGDIFSNKKRVIEFFTRLREISHSTGLTCREVEKALFKKNLEENK